MGHLKGLLMLGHIALAGVMQLPELKLSEPECDAYAQATAEFLRWHVPGISLGGGKRASELGLILTLGMIYVPKALAIVDRKRKEIDAHSLPNGHATAAVMQ